MIKGSHHTGGAKKKIGDANRNRHPSTEAKRKMSLAQSDRKGSKAARWAGGIRHRGSGRIHIYQSEHPFATRKGYILRARLVMEGILRRYLSPEEVVHHINGIKDDDQPENLKLFPNQAEHIKHHEEVRRANCRRA